MLQAEVTADRVATFFAHLLRGDLQRWALPGLGALNLVLHDVLGGTGGTSTLRYDPQGKSYAATLLTLPVDVPAAWENQGLLAPDPSAL